VIRRWGRRIVWLAAGLSVLGAVLLAVVAVDLLRTPGEVERDDDRFQAAPMRQRGLWDIGALPRDLNEKLLGLEDDVVYRTTVAMYLKVEPGRVDYEGFSDLEALRAKVQYELTRLSQEEPDRKRRSRLLTLHGVMTIDTRLPDEESRKDQLRRAVSAFRNAIELDPENADAKMNLEAVLSREGPVVITPANAPTSTRAGGRRSGQGRSGSGY
jgi:hypothetical protein